MANALVIAPAAIAERDIKKAIVAKVDSAAVVIELRLINAQQFAGAAGIDRAATRSVYPPFCNDGLMIGRFASWHRRKVSLAIYRFRGVGIK